MVIIYQREKRVTIRKNKVLRNRYFGVVEIFSSYAYKYKGKSLFSEPETFYTSLLYFEALVTLTDHRVLTHHRVFEFCTSKQWTKSNKYYKWT